jgi:amphiphysin
MLIVCDQLQELSITKRGGMSTAQILSQARVNQAAGTGLRSKAGSISSRTGTAGSRFTPPISRHNSSSTGVGQNLSPESSHTAGGGTRVLAPPPYSPSGLAAGGASNPPMASPGLSGKRAPPPPLKARPSAGPKPTYVVALYDFQAQGDDDLSFQTGDRM